MRPEQVAAAAAEEEGRTQPTAPKQKQKQKQKQKPTSRRAAAATAAGNAETPVPLPSRADVEASRVHLRRANDVHNARQRFGPWVAKALGAMPRTRYDAELDALVARTVQQMAAVRLVVEAEAKERTSGAS
jgi:hypothetical protein